jgi:HTH-type transcriptional regulator/antitoxin HigA
MTEIKNKTDYKKVMDEILVLMNKGEANVTDEESSKIRELAIAAQNFERRIYTIPLPTTLEGMIEMKMYEKKMNQAQLAKRLKLSTTKLSLILNRKQKPDIDFLKAVRTELEIDADFILDHV